MNIKKCHFVTAEPPSLSKWLSVCIRQDLGREHSIVQYVTLMRDVYQVNQCVKNGSCSSSSLE